MKVFNPSDMAPHPNCPWKEPVTVSRNGLGGPPGEWFDIPDAYLEDFQNSYRDRLGFGQKPSWYEEPQTKTKKHARFGDEEPPKKRKKTPRRKKLPEE